MHGPIEQGEQGGLAAMPHIPISREGKHCTIISCRVLIVGQRPKTRFFSFKMFNLSYSYAFLAGDDIEHYMENVMSNIPVPITKAAVKWALDQLPCNQETAMNILSMVRHFCLSYVIFIMMEPQDSM